MVSSSAYNLKLSGASKLCGFLELLSSKLVLAQAIFHLCEGFCTCVDMHMCNCTCLWEWAEVCT